MYHAGREGSDADEEEPDGNAHLPYAHHALYRHINNITSARGPKALYIHVNNMTSARGSKAGGRHVAVVVQAGGRQVHGASGLIESAFPFLLPNGNSAGPMIADDQNTKVYIPGVKN